MTWEERDRPAETVFFESPAAFAADMAPRPETFLLAGVMPAMDFGERRVEVEGAICPELLHGVEAAFRVITGWFPELTPPAIEPTRGTTPATPRTPPRVASFMSGGIDALTTLRSNRLDFPLDHPAALHDGFFLFGFNTYDFDASEPVPERVEDFEIRLARMAGIAREARIELIPVFTNVRFLARDFPSWNRHGMGAGLAAVGHVFAGRISRLLIGSAGYRGLGPPQGTHALLDPHYGNGALEVRHDGLWMSRLEKTALLTEWDSAMAIVQSCQQHQIIRESINCGRCNKCLRTMIHLAALGKLDRAPSFSVQALTVEMIRATPITRKEDVGYLEPCIELFVQRGRPDLAAALRSWLEDESARLGPAPPPRGWRGRVRQWDERVTGGVVTR
ncbi:MAG TPA: hypothetical protein VML54_04415, partial [Candidatus Limnocylindrales bacterium]|nr:hypothetical protein [Candidatus Limnocylindrales bacterium]